MQKEARLAQWAGDLSFDVYKLPEEHEDPDSFICGEVQCSL